MLGLLFNPNSIAVIGASDNPDKVGYSLMRNLFRYKGKLIPININDKTIMGLKAYKSISSYKRRIDLAIIAIPAKFAIKELIKCGKKGIKNVIMITAGFSEIGNIKEEQEIVNVANKYKINLLGPNCFGIFNPKKDLNATFAKQMPKKGDTSFISQSGALWSYLSDLDIGYSGFISLGNMAQLGFAEFIDYFSNDKNTKKIILYVEKIKNGKKFLEACKKCKKPIYVVKAGMSEEGKQAAISHTGSLATDYEIYKGIFKQAGINLVDSLEQALNLRKNNKKTIRLPNQVKIITNAGGAGALVSDYLAEKNIKSSVVDILGTASSKEYKQELRKKNGKLVLIVTPQTMTDLENIAIQVVHSDKKPLCLFLGKRSVEVATNMLKKQGILCFNSLEEFRKSL